MLTKVFVSIFLGAAVLTACGNDPNTTTADGCVGHTCSAGSAAVTDPEGGGIIFEHITFDTQLQGAFKLPAGEATATRVIAYFMSAQTPESNPLPMPGVCNNLETTKGWPLHVGTVHTDVDVGTLTIVGKNAAGADVSIDVPKQPKGVDQIGRAHDVFYQVVTPKASDLLKQDSFYDVKFGGSATVPATTFQQAIYLAADYPSVQNPDMENDGPLKAGVDFPVSWTVGNSVNKPPATQLVAGDVLGITWLVDMAGSPTHMCVVPANAQGFTIPGTAITEFKAAAAARGQPTDHLIMLRNAVAHQVVTLPLTTGAATNKRRIDMVSLECWAQLMNVQ
jgi:hypothetical protein